jgi:hypothetical protein
MSRDALQAWLGFRAQVKVFGTGAKSGERYGVNRWKKIQRLSEDLKFPLLATEEEVGKSGDRGLDLVATIPFPKVPGEGPDPADAFGVVWAQCATGDDWEDKQSAASEQEWPRLFTFTVPVMTVLMISYCIRESDGSWARATELAKNVVIDRLRFIQSLSGRGLPLSDFDSDLIDRALENRSRTTT